MGGTKNSNSMYLIHPTSKGWLEAIPILKGTILVLSLRGSATARREGFNRSKGNLQSFLFLTFLKRFIGFLKFDF